MRRCSHSIHRLLPISDIVTCYKPESSIVCMCVSCLYPLKASVREHEGESGGPTCLHPSSLPFNTIYHPFLGCPHKKDVTGINDHVHSSADSIVRLFLPWHAKVAPQNCTSYPQFYVRLFMHKNSFTYQGQVGTDTTRLLRRVRCSHFQHSASNTHTVLPKSFITE